MAPDRHRTTEFLSRVNMLLAEAKATRATIAQTDRILGRMLAARRDESLKALLGLAHATSGAGSIPVLNDPTAIRH